MHQCTLWPLAFAVLPSRTWARRGCTPQPMAGRQPIQVAPSRNHHSTPNLDSSQLPQSHPRPSRHPPQRRGCVDAPRSRKRTSAASPLWPVCPPVRPLEPCACAHALPFSDGPVSEISLRLSPSAGTLAAAYTRRQLSLSLRGRPTANNRPLRTESRLARLPCAASPSHLHLTHTTSLRKTHRPR